uniref:CHK domain-containing protein n=1 Tax=Glossina austeni TaxID=7395 RepID=A0A1A9UQR7_GLOAU
MANTVNNNNNGNSAMSTTNTSSIATTAQCPEVVNESNNIDSEEISPKIFKFFHRLAAEKGFKEYELITRPISEFGENSYGLVLQMTMKALTSNDLEIATSKELISIVKISPKHPARRAQMHVADFYAKEVLMYEQVFGEYRKLYEERLQALNYPNESLPFNVVPDMLYYSLEANNEFIIFEDLSISGYKTNARMQMPTYNLVMETFRSVAQLHALSFVLQARKPQKFNALIANIKEDLFIENMATVTVEFGKRYIKRARNLLLQDPKHQKKHIEILQKIEDNLRKILPDCVKGAKAAPYSVICHGDFWNNNVLYKYDINNQAVSAKLIDFQISRYSVPVLDLIHYLYTCTEKELRDKYFWEFMNAYYEALEKHLRFYGLDVNQIYPRSIFKQQLRDYGIYGFYIAAFSIPFFISNKNDIPDFDVVADAVKSISPSSSSSISTCSSLSSSDEELMEEYRISSEMAHLPNEKCLEILDEYDMLTERTAPVFKKRMTGIVEDLIKYEMLDNILKL